MNRLKQAAVSSQRWPSPPSNSVSPPSAVTYSIGASAPFLFPGQISCNLCFHDGADKRPDTCRLKPAARHGGVVQTLLHRPAAHVLARLEHRLPFVHREGALALRQEQLVVRGVAQDVQGLGRVGLAGAWVHDDGAAFFGRDGQRHCRRNRLERDGRREETEDGRV